MKQVFVDLVSTYASSGELALVLWEDISTRYEHPKRHYHNLRHLEHLYRQLLGVRQHIADWDTVLFSVFYHDVIYSATSGTNEEDSANYAAEHMRLMNVPENIINRCMAQILATQKHHLTGDNDTDMLTDADLAILGEPWDEYHHYTTNIRKEYSIYPDLLYKPGRKKVLQHFAGMEHIFKTHHFRTLLEEQARNNINRELSEL